MQIPIFNFSSIAWPMLLLFSTAMHGNAAEMHAAKLYEHSEWWPQRAALTEPVTAPGKNGKLSVGREGVLIRLEPANPPTLLLDFGRHGLLTLRPEQTDVLKRAERLASGEAQKEFPNWTMMLGRGFVDAGKEGTKVPLRDLLAYERFLFIYLHDVEASAPPLQAFLDEFAAAIEASDTLPVIFPIRDRISGSAYAQKLQAVGLDTVFMLPYLSDPYAASMHHSFGEPPFAILTDPDGKTLFEPSENQDWVAMLNQLGSAVVEAAKNQLGAGD